MIEIEEQEEAMCIDCTEKCCYFLYVYIRGHDREDYEDERCKQLKEKLKEWESKPT